jgi:hypothetical protein
MSKFEQIYSRIYEDVTGVTGASTTNAPTSTSAAANTPASTTPVANTPAGFDQQHPLIQALAKTTDPAAVVKLLQDNKVALPVPGSTTPTPNAA